MKPIDIEQWGTPFNNLGKHMPYLWSRLSTTSQDYVFVKQAIMVFY